MSSGSRLETEGFLLSRELRGRAEPTASTHPGAALALGITMATCCVLMVVDRGGPLTWIGAAGFAVSLVCFALVESRGVDRQAERMEELIRGKGDGSTGRDIHTDPDGRKP